MDGVAAYIILNEIPVPGTVSCLCLPSLESYCSCKSSKKGFCPSVYVYVSVCLCNRRYRPTFGIHFGILMRKFFFFSKIKTGFNLFSLCKITQFATNLMFL